MGAWVLPLTVAAFWAGLLASEGLPGPWWGWLLSGVASLVPSLLLVPAARPDPLLRVGLTGPRAPAVGSVAATRAPHVGHPLVVVHVVVVAVFACGVGWARLADLREDSSLMATLAPARVRVIGTLREDPRPGSAGWHGLLDVSETTWTSGRARLHETVWMSGDGELPLARRGDLVEVAGSLEMPEDPGFAEALEGKGTVAILRASSFERLGGSPNPFVAATQAARSVIGRSIESVFPPREAGLLLGLALGDGSQLDVSTERDFRATGLTHLLVVSGGNVAMVLAPVLALASMLGLARVGQAAIGIVTVVFFVILTGAEPSVMRAGAMAVIALIGSALGRPRSSGVLLSAAVLVLLVLEPWLVRSIGFQLSVAATSGLVALASPLGGALGRWMPSPLAAAVGTTLAAQLAVTPVLLYHFHEVPGVTLVANVAAAPAVSPSLLLGILAAFLGLVWMPLGVAGSLAAMVPMRYLELVANLLGRAPVAYITSRGGVAVLVVGGAAVAAFAVAIRTGWRPPRPLVIASLGLLPFVVWHAALTKGPPDGLTVRFFDVGQGDAALISSPGGAQILIDGGPDEGLVATDLAALGVKRLDLVVATHPHADHIAGLPVVLSRVPVSLLLQPGCPDGSALQADLDRAIADEGVSVRSPRAGESLTVADVRIDVLAPDRCWTGTESDTNNDSIVLRLSTGDDVILFTGDAEVPAQEELLSSGVDLRADVLKVPHHGGATSLPGIFQAVAPQVAIIQVGQPNDYGHPVPEVVDAVAGTGASVWRNDQHGTITVVFREGVPVVTTER